MLCANGDVFALISELAQHCESLHRFRRAANGIIRTEASNGGRLGSKPSQFVGVHDKPNRGVSIPSDTYNLAKTQRTVWRASAIEHDVSA